MNERERLIELLNKKQQCGVMYIENQMDSRYSESKEISNDELADYLIEKGVIFKRCEACEYIRIHKMNGLTTRTPKERGGEK